MLEDPKLVRIPRTSLTRRFFALFYVCDYNIFLCCWGSPQIIEIAERRGSRYIYIYIVYILYIYIYIYIYIRGDFNKFPDFFVQAVKIVLDSWKFSMLLLYILWEDWPIFMISASNEQLQQQLEYTLLKPDCHSWWISKMQSGREDTLEERYAIKFCFKLGKKWCHRNVWNASACFSTILHESSIRFWGA